MSQTDKQIDKLKQKLEDIRRGLEPSDGYYAIHEFGDENFIEARPEVEHFLTSDDPRLRYIALHVLTQHFGLQEYWGTALTFLRHDPDEDCRRMAASSLASLKRNTKDTKTLEALARSVSNKSEDEDVRIRAYTAMREVLDFDGREQMRIVGPEFDLERDADWQMIHSYIES